jgi:hypothetical protein
VTRRAALLLLLLGACSHSEPFVQEADPPANGPFKSARPLQLTLNLGLDGWPSFAPGETRVLYSAQDPAPEFDQCVLSLPATGGGATRVQCPLRVPDGLTESFDNPVSDGTRLAWVRAVVGVDAPAPFTWSLWMKTLSPPGTPVEIQSYPYDVPSGRVHDLPRFLQWLRPGVLLYLGSEAGGCCRTDTLQFGERAVLLDVTGPTPVRTFVPGTERASAVAGTPDGSAIVYTLFGDSLVYRQDLASGNVDVLHNFGSGHVARDPALSGNTLVAVIDGIIRVGDIPPFGVVQVDKGGLIRAVDLATGNETAVEDYSHFFRHLRLSSTGDRILAEGRPYQLIFVPIGGGAFRTDTSVTLINDVWLWEE